MKKSFIKYGCCVSIHFGILVSAVPLLQSCHKPGLQNSGRCSQQAQFVETKVCKPTYITIPSSDLQRAIFSQFGTDVKTNHNLAFANSKFCMQHLVSISGVVSYSGLPWKAEVCIFKINKYIKSQWDLCPLPLHKHKKAIFQFHLYSHRHANQATSILSARQHDVVGTASHSNLGG